MKVNKPVTLNRVKIYADSNELKIGTEMVRIRPKEMEVLMLLYRHSNTVVARSEILDHVWGRRYGNDTGLSQAISRLRFLLEDETSHGKLIKTVPKRGYSLNTKAEYQTRKLFLRSKKIGAISIAAIVAVLLILLLVKSPIGIRIRTQPASVQMENPCF